MIKNSKNCRRKGSLIRIASVLLTVMFVLMSAAPDFAYAARESTAGQPIREAHKVGVGEETYCFFVTKNVVLTPEEIAGMTNEELTAYIIDKAGLYMKRSNCKSLKNNKTISVKDWNKRNGGFFFSEPDLAGIREAQPVDGKPLKFYMDLLVCEDMGNRNNEEADETGDDEESEDGEIVENADKADNAENTVNAENNENAEEPEENEGEEKKDEEEDEEDEDLILYSTFKRNEPELIFAVVATETDAAHGQDMCKEDVPKEKKIKMSNSGESVDSEDETLPEYRTINMVDRSGKPIKATLEEGDPVKLEWVEPKHRDGDEGSSFIDRIPGGITGLVIICAAAAALIAAAVLSRKKKRTDW